jgi:hypothetical protein
MPERCGHCGYSGDLEEVARPVVKRTTADVELYGEVETLTYWFLYRCPRCEKATLEEDWWNDEFGDPEGDTAKQLFPAPRDNSSVPRTVLESYWEANRVQGEAPGLYAVGIRRTVEAICRDRGAKATRLEPMLDQLADEGVLPRPLAEMGHQLRARGNLGAHAGDVKVSVEDLPVIEEFVEAILEYVYRAPAKIAAAQSSLDARTRAEAS